MELSYSKMTAKQHIGTNTKRLWYRGVRLTEMSGSEINFLTWSPRGDFTRIFGRHVPISSGQFFSYSFHIKNAKMHVTLGYLYN